MQEWNEEQLNNSLKWNRTFCLYLYTPMCGTCQVASKILAVSLELFPDLDCGKMNLNYMANIAAEYEIESVPCLLVFKEGKLDKKIYAFHSVPYIYDILKEI
ncbi:thioredoxin family protein [Bacillus sp. MUM 13]|uniref:thioredoxin family protein n=1 Tax=Bacillus sp. MUM 13 TaxID=1678001 RepID=UPI0008F56EC6|nr:thioredoxin family protein [Bacillus sp. MUM 13]OIK12170.1 thiol reductase thioredoxin [Bacillus sp. MUM 13]